jgi:hypothetical protein
VLCVIMYVQGGADTLTLEEDAADRALLAYLLNGKRLKPRRDRHQPVEQPVDPVGLDLYQLLLWEQAPHLSRAELARAWFDWTAVLTLHEARAWFAAGARLHDLRTVRQLDEAGVLPERAGREVIRVGRPIGRTFLEMARLGLMTPHEVAAITNRPRPSRGSRGVGTPPEDGPAGPDERLTS